jgi:hypothetical protein
MPLGFFVSVDVTEFQTPEDYSSVCLNKANNNKWHIEKECAVV